MESVKRINGFFSLCFGILLLWSGPTSAGVPSPTPGAVDQLEVQIVNLGDFQFENGEIVKDFKVTYTKHGKLNKKKDNVILVMEASWGRISTVNFLIGPGKALDTDKYFIVAPDRLGSALSLQNITTGPTNSGLKMDFPRYTVRDEVNLEYKLLKEYFGFDHILAAIGTSIGGQKAYQFGVSYPTYCSGLIPMFSSPVTNPQTRIGARNLNAILELDSGWHGGEYEVNPVWAVHTAQWNEVEWFFTPEWFATALKTEEQYREFEKWWDNYFRNYPLDARDWYYTNLSWGTFDIGETRGFNGDAEAALKSIQAQVLIIGGKGDMFFRPEESIFAESAIPNATYLEIDSPWGHASCCGADTEGNEIMNKEIAEFLSKLTGKSK